MGFLERQASKTVVVKYRMTGCAIRGAESMNDIIYTFWLNAVGY